MAVDVGFAEKVTSSKRSGRKYQTKLSKESVNSDEE
jgi:hypothetical protein